MSKRESKKLITQNFTVVDAENLIGDYADADAKQRKIESQMDIEITKIREKNAEKLAELSGIKKESLEKLQHYAMSNPELFSKKKSFDLTHGTIGFRTGTPTITKSKGLTWEAVTLLLKKFLPDYVRTKEEANKERLLADRDKPEIAEKMADCGVSVEQTETFYIELKTEEAVTA